MAKFIKGNPVENATEYELIEKILPEYEIQEKENLFNNDIVNQYYKNGCFLASSAKWYSVASFRSSNLLPLAPRPTELYIYGLKQSAEMHLTWYDNSAKEEAPTADAVGSGNIAPVGGFTIKNGTNVGSGNVTFTYVTDSKGNPCFKFTMVSTYQSAASYIRLGIGTSAPVTSFSDIYITQGERYQIIDKGEQPTYETLTTKNEINFDVSSLNLSAGNHIFVVKAKGEDYEDSDYSNEVSCVIE